MTFINKLIVFVLSEDNAVHIIFFRNISENYKVIVFQIFDFYPVLCSAVKIISAVLSLRNNTLQFLLFRKIIKKSSTVFSIYLETANLLSSDFTAFCKKLFLRSVSGKSVTCLFSKYKISNAVKQAGYFLPPCRFLWDC